MTISRGPRVVKAKRVGPVTGGTTPSAPAKPQGRRVKTRRVSPVVATAVIEAPKPRRVKVRRVGAKAKPVQPPKAQEPAKPPRERNRDNLGRFQKKWTNPDIEFPSDGIPIGNHKQDGSLSRFYSRLRFHERASYYKEKLEAKAEQGQAELRRYVQTLSRLLGIGHHEIYTFFMSA